MTNDEALAMMDFVETLFTDKALIPEWKKLLDHDLITKRCATKIGFLTEEAQKRVYIIAADYRMTDEIAHQLANYSDYNNDRISDDAILNIVSHSFGRRTPTLRDECDSLIKDMTMTVCERGMKIKQLTMYYYFTHNIQIL